MSDLEELKKREVSSETKSTAHSRTNNGVSLELK